MRRYIPHSVLIYGKYALTGAIVGVMTVGLRETFGMALPADTPLYYAISVVMAYVIGIGLSYYGHWKFTFRHRELATATARRFSWFTLIAIVGLITTAVVSLGIRYGFEIDKTLGQYGAGAAFALATFLASLLTYGLNSWYTFCPAGGQGVTIDPGFRRVSPERRSLGRPPRARGAHMRYDPRQGGEGRRR